MPTDYQGIKWINISDSNPRHYIREDLRAWLDGIPTKLRMMPNVYLDSREEVGKVRNADYYSTERAKEVYRIRLLNFSASNIFTQQNIDQKQIIRSMEGVLLQFFKESLRNGAELIVITNAPTDRAREDIITKAPDAQNKNGGFLHETYIAIQKLLHGGEDERSDVFINSHNNNRFHHKLTDIILPYGLLQIEFKGDSEKFANIKVDLYSPELNNANDRRSMVIFKSSDSRNYDFFSSNIDMILKKQCLSEDKINALKSAWST